MLENRVGDTRRAEPSKAHQSGQASAWLGRCSYPRHSPPEPHEKPTTATGRPGALRPTSRSTSSRSFAKIAGMGTSCYLIPHMIPHLIPHLIPHKIPPVLVKAKEGNSSRRRIHCQISVATSIHNPGLTTVLCVPYLRYL